MATVANATPSATLSASTWKTHLTDDLLPFWSNVTPATDGQFPGNLCNDGTLPVAGTACDGVSLYRANTPQETLVAQSRQVFSYAIAFHMTGNETYLAMAEAGLDYQFDTFLDVDSGLFQEVRDVSTGDMWTSASGPQGQKQAYGLLGASFLYYLTGDEALSDRITSVEQAISQSFFDSSDGSYSQYAGGADPSARLEDHLDQLNAYKVRMATIGPAVKRAQWLAEVRQTASYITDTFHDPATGLFKTSTSDPVGSVANADLGLSMKTYWYLDQLAGLTDDAALSRFAQDGAISLFDRGFRPDIGAWTTEYDANGAPSSEAAWWSYTEFNQFMTSLAATHPEFEATLSQVQAYWLENFVDDTFGGIYPGVDLTTGDGNDAAPKHWEWKAGFHAFEHALVSLLGAAALNDEDVDLFFARDAGGDAFDLTYGFFGQQTVNGQLSDGSGDAVQRVTFSDIYYGPAVMTAVPLPGSQVLLISGLALGFMRHRRRARFLTGRTER